MEKDDERNCLLTPKETAKILKISRSSLYSLLKSGKLPAMKIGRQWRILKKELFRNHRK